MKITRRELHAQVWAIPIQRLAADLGTSSKAIHAACNSHQIPKPGRGYWRRRETGQSIPVAPLPNAEKDAEIHLPSGNSSESVGVTTSFDKVITAPETADQQKAPESSSQIVQTTVDPIAILKRLPDPNHRHQLLSALDEEANQCAPGTAAAVRAWVQNARDAAVVLDLMEEVIAACGHSQERAPIDRG